MTFNSIRGLACLVLLSLLGACAQIVPPQGGQKDVTPPKLLSVTPADSALNTRVTRIDMRFDEFVTISNAASEITVSPILPFPLDVTALKKTVTVKIPDSLLKDNTTYRISMGKAIQDVHENNPFTGYSYIFSTGNYFDSLSLEGFIINAATGQRDTGALVVLYEASKSDSAVVRQKPLYAVKADAGGNFRFDGLPETVFRIYAMRDANNNMVYDGSGEMIAFLDSAVRPSLAPAAVRLSLFAESDTSSRVIDNAGSNTAGKSRMGAVATNAGTAEDGFTYVVGADTSDTRKRTAEIIKPVEISFTRPVAEFNSNRVNLSYDSLGVLVEASFTRVADTSRKSLLLLNINWKENTLYTLRLLKGFARDSAGTDAMPGRYTFRTKRDEDYGKLHVHLPSKYYGAGFVFVLLSGDDTVYQRTVQDTMIHFARLQPGTYSMHIIIDRNKNGKWDTGDLFDKVQPEEVIPYINQINLKAGWENLIDFEDENKGRPNVSPGAGDRLRR